MGRYFLFFFLEQSFQELPCTWASYVRSLRSQVGGKPIRRILKWTCRRTKSTLSLPCSLIIIFSFSSVEYMEKTAWTESRITSQTPFMQSGFHGSLSRVWRKHFWTKSKLTDLKCQCTFHCWIWIVKLCRHF